VGVPRRLAYRRGAVPSIPCWAPSGRTAAQRRHRRAGRLVSTTGAAHLSVCPCSPRTSCSSTSRRCPLMRLRRDTPAFAASRPGPRASRFVLPQPTAIRSSSTAPAGAAIALSPRRPWLLGLAHVLRVRTGELAVLPLLRGRQHGAYCAKPPPLRQTGVAHHREPRRVSVFYGRRASTPDAYPPRSSRTSGLRLAVVAGEVCPTPWTHGLRAVLGADSSTCFARHRARARGTGPTGPDEIRNHTLGKVSPHTASAS